VTGSLLQAERLRKSFGGLRAVDGIDLEARRGERRAIIGPNGAGKTTLFNLITGHLRPDEGRVVFDGQDVTGLSTDRIARAGIGRAFQITNIFPGLTVFENVQLGFICHRRDSRAFLRPAAGMYAEEVREILDAVGLLHLERERAGTLSHGDQRALELAISLALEPKLLLLDEPTAGMAPAETRRTMDLVRRIAAERHLTLLFCEHDMEVVFGTAEWILVMHQGRLLAEGTPDDIRTDSEVRRVYLGDEA
jgi:branched-chain amino acid transport system ATP-binding protein